MAEYKVDEAKLKEVCSVLKAVLTSFGGELPMEKIENEFKTVVGASIPYKDFKHGTLASFLQSIPNVLNLVYRGRQLWVTVVNDENINLILQQVREQNNSKSKKAVQKNQRLATRQLHATPGPPQPLVNSRWQNTNSLYNGTRHPPRSAGFWSSQLPNHESNWRPSRPHTPPYSPRGSFKASPHHHQGLQMKVTTPTPPPGFQSTKASHPPPGFTSRNVALVTTTSTPAAIAAAASTTGFQSNENTRPKSPATPKATSPSCSRKTFKQQCIEAFEQLETNNKQMELCFKNVPCGKKKEWCCVVMIGNSRLSSYPDTTKTPEEAEEAACKKALEFLRQLKKKEADQSPASTDYTESIRLVQQLFEGEKAKKKIWWHAVQEMYLNKHKERLPQDWLNTVRTMSNTGLVFNNPCMDKWTIGLADKSEPTPSQNSVKSETNTSREPPRTPSPRDQNAVTGTRTPSPPSSKPQLPPIELPETPTWSVFITCLEDDATIQLVLVGEKYGDMYKELLTEMELYYMEEKNQEPVKEPVIGEVYVASHEESWLRVELVDVVGDEIKVKFLDHGDIEAIPLANLYHLHSKFFCLPAQALQCCLPGLEDAPSEAAFQAVMETIPMGKTLVARVQRRQKPYGIVLYDTSTHEDVNLNDKVFESLALSLEEPSLPQAGGLAEVYLIHVSADGTLYVQIESKTYKILEDLLKIAKRRTEEMMGEKGVQVDLTKLYLARFSKDGDWYRAAPRTTVDPDGMVLMKFVDFGNSEKIPVSNLRGLQKLSPLLAKVPHQALPCCLHNVPNNPELRWTTQACERLTSLASPDFPLLLKVVNEETSSRPPVVQLFKRLLPQNELVSINDTLGIDTSLFRSEGDSNNNSMEKVFTSQQQQQQQQQSSSASGSPPCSLPSNLPQVGPEGFLQCSPLSSSDIPDEGCYFDVFVTFAANPNHFAVQPWKMSRPFDRLSESIQKYYQDPVNLKNVTAIESGQYCAVLHNDNIWYRAKVEVVMETSVAGIFVDFGDRFFTSLDKVQPLTPEFCTVPCLAIKAELYGIKAANKDWTPEDACRFRELASNKNLVSIISRKNVKNNTCINLSLALIDTSDKTVDVHINQILVGEGRAVVADKR